MYSLFQVLADLTDVPIQQTLKVKTFTFNNINEAGHSFQTPVQNCQSKV
jgi:hypothetical protein